MSELTRKKFGPEGAPMADSFTIKIVPTVLSVLLFLWLVEFLFKIHLFL